MKKNIIIIASIVILLILMGVMLVSSIVKIKKITGIKRLYFTYTNGYSAYSYTRYEIEKREDGYYVKIKPDGMPEEEMQEAKMSNDDIEKIIQVLNENKVIKWDVFHDSDKYVLDGDSFSFSLTANDDIDISASGYMRWPKNYGIVESTLVEILDAYYKYDSRVYE